MRRRQVIGSAVAGIVFVVAGSCSAVAASASSTVTLPGLVLGNIHAANDLGMAPSTDRLTLGVLLGNRDQAGADAYLASEYDSHSALYHHPLTPSQFEAQFGPSHATFAAAGQWLTGDGLTVTTVPGATNYLEASGTAAQVEALTATAIHDYRAAGRTFYANTSAPSVPADLGIETIVGLNDWGLWQTPHMPVTPAANVPVTGQLTPQALWSIYDQPANNFGEGQTMAVFGWTASADQNGVDTTGAQTVSDLRIAEQHWNFPQVPIQYNLYGDTSTPDTDQSAAQGEWDLDTQASTGMSPNVQQEKLYFAHHSTDADILAAFTAWINDPSGPLQGSASFGECENIPGAATVIGTDGLETAGETLFQQAVAEMRTLFVSTGDTGSSCPVAPVDTNGLATQLYPGIEYPAGSAYAVAVGGTVLTSDGGNPPQRLTETAWEYGGGGNSCCITAGSYQANQATLNCASDQNGNPYTPPGPLCRSIPDVAAQSGDVATGNGLTIYSGGTFGQGAGTSLSAPMWDGLWTRIQAAALPNSSGVYAGNGFANEAFYAIGNTFSPTSSATEYGRDFYDITVGDNQPYPAKPGYDNATGWGSPDVSNMLKDVDGVTDTRPSDPLPAPVPATPATAISCGNLFTHPAGQDNYSVEGQTPPGSSPGGNPQLSIVAGSMQLSADGTTLSTIIHLSNLSATVPTGGGENDYNMVWQYNGTSYFTQVAVEQNGTVLYFDGQAVTVSLETKYAQLHSDTGKFVTGADGYVEVDVPLSNVGNPALGEILAQPSAQSYVREGATNGPLEPVDSAPAQYNFVLLTTCVGPSANVPETPLTPLLALAGGVAAAFVVSRRRRRTV